MNEKALKRFVELIGEAKELLEVLTTSVEDHLNVAPDDVDWADVGSLNHAVTSLKDIVEFLDN